MKNDKNNTTESTRPAGFQDVPKRRCDVIETPGIDAAELFPETYDRGAIAIGAYEAAIGDGEGPRAQEALENALRDRNKRLREEAEKNRPAWADISLEDFEAIMSSAWTTAHPLVEEAEMSGRTDRLLEIVREHRQEIGILNDAVQEFYEFSGSDADTWDSWTEPISEAADELLDRIGAEFHEQH